MLLFRCRPAIALGAVVLSLVFVAFPSWSGSDDLETLPKRGDRNANSTVFPPNSHPYGLSYAEWVAMGGQMLFATPYDPTASVLGMVGNVALLSANTGGASTLSGTVPAGTSFLFVVVTDIELAPFWCGEGTGAPNCTVEELRAVAAGVIDGSMPFLLQAEIDGVPLKNLYHYRFESTVWYGVADENNLFGPYGVVGPYGPAVADGFWILTTPLPPGDHTIHVRAVASDGWETEITHYLTVLQDQIPLSGTAPTGTNSGTWSQIKALYR